MYCFVIRCPGSHLPPAQDAASTSWAGETNQNHTLHQMYPRVRFGIRFSYTWLVSVMDCGNPTLHTIVRWFITARLLLNYPLLDTIFTQSFT